jgi:hypothetical protein
MMSSLSNHAARAQQPAVLTPAPIPATPPAPPNFHIYLLMGQSNMVGRDTRSLASQVNNPRVLAFTPDNSWTVAREPITADTKIPVGQGPGIPFAVEMLKVSPKIAIGLVPCAVGGTPLSRWVKGADLYESCMVRARTAAKFGSIEGVLWHQGEADTTTKENADSYETRLTQMFGDLRADLGLPNVPIVVGQLGPFLAQEKYPFVDTVRAAIQHMPADLAHVGFADSAGLEDRGDKLHFSAAAQTTFGGRYAKAMQEAGARK